MNLSNRSYEKEMLDKQDIPFHDIKRNMQELELINKYLGGHRITIKGFRNLLPRKNQLSICEIGCGGGDNLKVLNNWCKKKSMTAKFTGIDINPDCITYAKENCSYMENVQFITSDYKMIFFGAQKPDIIFSSLFCHHLNNDQFIEMLNWLKVQALCGFFINDVHRHILPYYFIKWTTALFSKSYLVKNDAPVSIKRGFKRKELIHLMRKAGITNYRIKWEWAFRWLVEVKNS